MGVRVLIVSQHFWPESFRINEVARALREAGCRVTVLTAQPNYPDGEIFAGYSAAAWQRPVAEDVYEVCRVPIIPRFRGRALQLLANYCSFILSAGILGPVLLRGRRFDVVFVYGTSPILQAIPAIFLKKLKRAALVVWVQDLWPQSLEETGFVRSRSVLAGVDLVVRWIYARADLVLAQSRAFAKIIAAQAGARFVEFFPNPSERLNPAEPAREPALLLEPGFNVVFAGNLGTVQALDTIVEAATLVQDDPDIRFVLVGSGSRLDWVRQRITERQLGNVRLAGRFAASEMPAILSQASALLVSLINRPAMARTIPSKIQTYMAVGRPILAALDGEGARVVLEAGAGLAVPGENAPALADAVRRLKRMGSVERDRMGESGRRYHAEHFDSRLLARRLIGLFQAVAKP